MDNLIYVCVKSTQRKDFIKLLRDNGYRNVSVCYSPGATLLVVDSTHKSLMWLNGSADSQETLSVDEFIDLFL